jgi:hypothetical protein
LSRKCVGIVMGKCPLQIKSWTHQNMPLEDGFPIAAGPCLSDLLFQTHHFHWFPAIRNTFMILKSMTDPNSWDDTSSGCQTSMAHPAAILGSAALRGMPMELVSRIGNASWEASIGREKAARLQLRKACRPLPHDRWETWGETWVKNGERWWIVKHGWRFHVGPSPAKFFFCFGTGQLSLATQAFPGSGSPRDVRSRGGQGAMAAMAA